MKKPLSEEEGQELLADAMSDQVERIEARWDRIDADLRRDILGSAPDCPQVLALLQEKGVPLTCGATWLAETLESELQMENLQGVKAILKLRTWSPVACGIAATTVASLRGHFPDKRVDACLKILRKHGASEARIAEGDLEHAAAGNNPEGIRAALAKGARLRSPHGTDSWYMAATHEEPKALMAMLEAGKPGPKIGGEAIRAAFTSTPRAQKAIDLLRNAGADGTVLTAEFFIEACGGKDSSIVAFSWSLTRNLVGMDVRRAMKAACSSGLTSTVKFLAEAGAPIAPTDNAPFIAATVASRKDVMETLIHLGADPREPMLDNGTPSYAPLFQAKLFAQPAILDWLLGLTKPPESVIRMIELTPSIKSKEAQAAIQKEFQ